MLETSKLIVAGLSPKVVVVADIDKGGTIDRVPSQNRRRTNIVFVVVVHTRIMISVMHLVRNVASAIKLDIMPPCVAATKVMLKKELVNTETK